jgi:tryptophan synthase alpha chain
VVDLPPEEDSELYLPASEAGLDFIRLATPTTDDIRLEKILRSVSGFVYYVSITGVTGAAVPDVQQVSAAVARIRSYTDLPVAVGFGVRSAKTAALIAENADAVVVGSAIVDALRASLDTNNKPTSESVRSVINLVNEISEGLKNKMHQA